MPLTEKVNYKTALRVGNVVQVPKIIRDRFKIDSDQTLKVGVNFSDLHRGWQFFYAKMHKDGRLTVPMLVLNHFREETAGLAGCVAEMTLEPA